jgi:hypothetical protein
VIYYQEQHRKPINSFGSTWKSFEKNTGLANRVQQGIKHKII